MDIFSISIILFLSLDEIFIISITDHRHKPLEPRQLVQVLHRINIRVWASRRWLVRMITKAEPSFEESLYKSQLCPFLLSIALENSWHGIETAPCPHFCFLIWGWHRGFKVEVVFAPECALASLDSIPIFSPAGVAELMPTPVEKICSF